MKLVGICLTMACAIFSSNICLAREVRSYPAVVLRNIDWSQDIIDQMETGNFSVEGYSYVSRPRGKFLNSIIFPIINGQKHAVGLLNYEGNLFPFIVPLHFDISADGNPTGFMKGKGKISVLYEGHSVRCMLPVSILHDRRDIKNGNITVSVTAPNSIVGAVFGYDYCPPFEKGSSVTRTQFFQDKDRIFKKIRF